MLSIRLQLAAIMVMLVASLPIGLPAQDRANQQSLEQVRQRLEEVRERLELTPEQVEQIRPVLVEELQKFRAARDKYNDSNQNRRDRRKAARELRKIQGDADDKLKKILSRKQMDELKKIREEWRESRNRNQK